MDPVTTSQMVVSFGEVAMRTTAEVVRERVSAAKERNDLQAVVEVQDEMLSRLIEDKADLVRMGNSLREQFVVQQIDSQQLEWISKKVVPLIKKWALKGSDSEEARRQTEEMFSDLEELLDPELLQVAQVLGFNFKYAIGEALSELVHRAISPSGAGGGSSSSGAADPLAGEWGDLFRFPGGPTPGGV